MLPAWISRAEWNTDKCLLHARAATQKKESGLSDCMLRHQNESRGSSSYGLRRKSLMLPTRQPHESVASLRPAETGRSAVMPSLRWLTRPCGARSSTPVFLHLIPMLVFQPILLLHDLHLPFSGSVVETFQFSSFTFKFRVCLSSQGTSTFHR